MYIHSHILRWDSATPANRAMVQYFKKTIGGIQRTIYAGAQKTSIMTMLRDEYRTYTNATMKQIVGTAQFTHGIDLDKFRVIAQEGTKWAALVNHITNTMRVVWVRTNCTRKQQEVPWSSTPVIRVRPEQTPESPEERRYRELYPDCWASMRQHHQRVHYIYK